MRHESSSPEPSQETQSDEPSPANSPSGHGVHAAAPAALYVSTPHRRHCVTSACNCASVPMSARYDPAGHASHADEPIDAW